MHFAKLTVFFLTYNRCLVSFSNFVVVLITGYDDFAPILSVIIVVIKKLDSCLAVVQF